MEHPLLFTTEMVRAVLDGRKIQTRRVPIERYRNWKVGDTIWVRESYTTQMGDGGYARGRYKAGADWFVAPNKNLKHPTKKLGMITIPSIHMPRWAARIFLKITGLRDERVQDISEEDCYAEGIITGSSAMGHVFTAKEHFEGLWDSINAKRHNGIYAWDKNPKVKVIEFKRL